jgi:predicted HTH transcriptional regulator
MKSLFDRLKDEKFAVIEELVRDRYQETVQLDFKTKANAKSGELSKNDRAVLGPALSALANSAGGLLIWGIEARKDPVDGIDAAQAKVPISGLSQVFFRGNARGRSTTIAKTRRH